MQLTQKDIRENRQAYINELINKSSLPVKENLLYILAEMMRTLANDIEGDVAYLRNLYKEPQLKVLGDKRRQFMLYADTYTRGKILFDTIFDADMDKSLNWKSKDELRADANELLRLDMLFIDRAARDLDNANLIFKYIRSLPSYEIISEKEIARFEFKA